MAGLSFLYPAFLIGAAAIAIPIVLHLLRREAAPQLPFSTVRFLKHAPVEQTRRKRIRELVLLVLRVSALLLLALAFARPYFSDGAAAASASVTVVAVDTSFSLSGPGQFDRSRALARQAIDAAPAGHGVAIVAFSDTADVIVEPTGNRGVAKAALTNLAPGFGGTRYPTALARAAEVIGARSGRIVVVTDLQRTGWEVDDPAAVPDRIAVEVADVAPPEGNLAIAGFRREGAQTIVTVLHSGRVGKTAPVKLSVDARPLGNAVATLEEGISTDVTFDVALPERGVASVTIEDPRGYQVDNTRYLVLDPPPPALLLAIGDSGRVASDAFYLDRAIAVAGETGDTSPFLLTTLSAEAAARIPSADLDRYGAVLLLSTRRFDRAGWETFGAYLRQGGGMLVAADGQVEAGVVRELLGEGLGFDIDPSEAGMARLSFTPADLRHPIFRPFGVFAGNLGQVRFERTRRLRGDQGSGGLVIARFNDGRPALAEYRVGKGRVIVFASDLNNRWNDFPLHPGFVPFVHETMRYLVRDREQPSDYVIADAPRDVPPQPGVATLAGGRRRVAINVDVKESNVARLTPEEFAGAISRLNREAAVAARDDAGRLEALQNIWRYGLMLMLLALAAEGLIGTRVA